MSSNFAMVSAGSLTKINGGNLPDAALGAICTIWKKGDPNTGILFYAQADTSPATISRATTIDGGLTWTAGVPTGIPIFCPLTAIPSYVNRDWPVVRDLFQDGNLTAWVRSAHGSVQGAGTISQEIGFTKSGDLGVTWTTPQLVTFHDGSGPITYAGAGNTGLRNITGVNGFVEVFNAGGGVIRAYTADNNGISSTFQVRVDAADGAGLSFADELPITMNGPRVVPDSSLLPGSGGVFTFVDSVDNAVKLGGIFAGQGSGNWGIQFLYSADNGVSWTVGSFSLLNSDVLGATFNVLSDNLIRVFFNIGSTKSLWYQDFTVSGASSITPSNLFRSGPPSSVLFTESVIAPVSEEFD